MAINDQPSTGSSLTIEELSARPGAKQRVLVLLGGGLPKMGAEWGSKLVMKTRWYAGNSTEATQHVLVATEVPSTWEGVWRRTMLSRRPCILKDDAGQEVAVVDPHLLREELEDIHRSAALLRVTWAVDGTELAGQRTALDDTQVSRDVSVRIVRVGRISDFSTPIDRHTDIRWKATFEWIGRGGSSSRVARVRGNEDVDAMINSFQASADALDFFLKARIWQVKDVPRSANVFTLGKLESMALDVARGLNDVADLPTKRLDEFSRTVQRGLSDMKRLGDVARKFRTLPASLASQMRTIRRNVQIASDQLDDDLGRAPAEAYTRKPGAAAVIRGIVTVSDAQARARDCNDKLAKIDDALRPTRVTGANRGVIGSRSEPRATEGRLLAVYVCRDGDTPQTVSRRFYGTADRGVDILRANRMPWHTPRFARGQVLAIPALSDRSSS